MNAKRTLAAVAGAAVLVIPGAGLIQTATAADSNTGTATTEQAPQLVPVQEERQPSQPRPEDCPEKDGRGGGSGSGADGGAESGGSGTAL